MNDDEKAYAEYLDEVYGEVDIAGYTYGTGQALYEVDPIAFRVGMSDWESDNEDEGDE